MLPMFNVAVLLFFIGLAILLMYSLYLLLYSTAGSRFKVGERIVLDDRIVMFAKYNVSCYGEVVRVRKNFSFRYDYDIVPEYVTKDKLLKGVYQHNLTSIASFDYDISIPPPMSSISNEMEEMQNV